MSENRDFDSLIEKYTSELIDMGTRFNHPFSKPNETVENTEEVPTEDISDESTEQEQADTEEPIQENLYTRELFADENELQQLPPEPEATQALPEKEVPPLNPENFALFRAVVFTADGAFPVKNARVVVKKNGELHAFLFTNGSGETKTVRLESYPEKNSLDPNSNQQYMQYTADIHAEGFESLRELTVEAVGGSQILLQENLVPAGGSL